MSITFICPVCERTMQMFKVVDFVTLYECSKCRIARTHLVEAIKKGNIEALGYNYDSYMSHLKKYKDRYIRLLSLIKIETKYPSLLDIGSGFGLFSLLASEKYSVTSIEPYLPQTLIYNQTDIVKHKIKFKKFFITNKKQFDVIALLDVFEHLEDPNEALQQILALLNSNGIVLIQCPNYFSFMQYACKKWAWWMVSDHKYHYSSTGLKKMLIKNGYKIIKDLTYEDIYDFKKNLDGNFESIKPPLIRKVIKLCLYTVFFPVYIVVRPLIWKLKLGGLTVVYAQKNS